MGMSVLLKNQLRKHLFRSGTFPDPTIMAIALYVGVPTGGGTEVVGGAYGRVNLPPLDANWTGDIDGLTKNAIEVVYAVPTAAWGTVDHVAFYDALTAGNLILEGALTAPRTIPSGAPAPRFAAGSIVVSFD